MSLVQARQEKAKVKLAPVDTTDPNNIGHLPKALRDLIARSQQLQIQVRRLDSTIHTAVETAPSVVPNPVSHQLGLLKAAFSADA
jgi:regulator of CtrA degradation